MKNPIKYLAHILLNEKYTLQQRLFNLASFAVLIGIVISGLLSLLIDSSPVANLIIVIMCIFSFFTLYASLNSKNLRAYRISSAVYILFVDLVFLPVLYFFSGGQVGGAPIWFLIGLVAPILMIPGVLGYILYILALGGTVATFILEYHHPDWVVAYSTPADYSFDLIQSSVIVSLVLCLMYRFQNHQYEKQRKQLEERDKELMELHTGLEEEVLRQTQKAEERREKVERISHQAMKTLANTIDAKDKYTKGHSLRVAWYSRELAKRLGLNEREQKDIYYMGLLHDIGKIGIPDGIINKPSKLTDEEYSIIKNHPVTGDEILREMTELKGIETGARWHHERYDGKGYPDNLKGKEIPFFARIIGVADAYDAMTSNRSYRSFLPQDEVRRQIKDGAGSQFDPAIAKEMLKMIDDDIEYQYKEESGFVFE